MYKTINNQVFAFINCCEHEFSIASDISGGSNPLNPIVQYYAIQEAKEKADRKASLDRRKNDIKITIESLQRQKAELDRRIKWCQEQNKGIKDKHTKEVNKAQIDQCRKQKENLNNSIERERERLRNL